MVQYSTFILFSNIFQILSENKCLSSRSPWAFDSCKKKYQKSCDTTSFRKIQKNWKFYKKWQLSAALCQLWLRWKIAFSSNNFPCVTGVFNSSDPWQWQISHYLSYKSVELYSRASTKLYHFMFLRSFLSRKWECFSAKNLT